MDHVRFDGMGADIESRRNLRIAGALLDQPQNLYFAGAQIVLDPQAVAVLERRRPRPAGLWGSAPSLIYGYRTLNSIDRFG